MAHDSTIIFIFYNKLLIILFLRLLIHFLHQIK